MLLAQRSAPHGARSASARHTGRTQRTVVVITVWEETDKAGSPINNNVCHTHAASASTPPLPPRREAEARCERAEGELRAKVAEAVEARGRAARSEEALRQLQQSAATKEKEGGDIQREQAAREATLREEAKLARREKEMMQEMVSSA